MNVGFFLKQRTLFIRFFFEESARPFRKIQSKIELEQPPFDNPPYSEDPEPPYVQQWSNAALGMEVLGKVCVSMLADTLKLYLNALKDSIGFRFDEEEISVCNKGGFVAAFRMALGEILDTDWADCPVNFDIIEQVVLARNDHAHGGQLSSFHVPHNSKSLRKHRRPFFANERELQLWKELGGSERSLFRPGIEVGREALLAAIGEVEKLADWIGPRLDRAWEWQSRCKELAHKPQV
jgi:hypothetical protein